MSTTLENVKALRERFKSWLAPTQNQYDEIFNEAQKLLHDIDNISESEETYRDMAGTLLNMTGISLMYGDKVGEMIPAYTNKTGQVIVEENITSKEVAQSKGLEYLKMAANMGHAGAMLNIGSWYCANRKCDEGLKWLEKAEGTKSAQENSNIQSSLGIHYYHLHGIDPKHLVKAIHFLTLAANQDDAVAQERLGACYLIGIGVKKDEKQAVKWLIPSAEQGNAQAQLLLGHCSTQKMSKKDIERVARLSEVAAANGNCYEQAKLAWNYVYGKGVKSDLSKAGEYFFQVMDNPSPHEEAKRSTRIALEGKTYKGTKYIMSEYLYLEINKQLEELHCSPLSKSQKEALTKNIRQPQLLSDLIDKPLIRKSFIDEWVNRIKAQPQNQADHERTPLLSAPKKEKPAPASYITKGGYQALINQPTHHL